MRILILSIALLTLLAGCSNHGRHSSVLGLESPAPEIILSINHGTFSESNQPSSLRISRDTLYTITKWRGWEGKKVEYKNNIYDGEGKLAFSMSGRLLPDKPVYYYQSNYGPHPVIDKPGSWLIEVYADNVLVSTKKIEAVR